MGRAVLARTWGRMMNECVLHSPCLHSDGVSEVLSGDCVKENSPDTTLAMLSVGFSLFPLA